MKDITPRLSKNETTKLLDDIHTINKRPAKQTVGDLFLFVKRLAIVLTALSVIGLGITAAYIGKFETTMLIKQVALIVSGLLATLDGMYLLYKALMKTE